MSLGNNLQYLRRLSGGMSQEALAERLGVSRQTVSKWELDAALPEIDKAIELCRLFGCTLDNLFREDMGVCRDAYSNMRVEDVPAFRYISHTVISTDPESDALDRVRAIAHQNGVAEPRIIGWDFPFLSQEQINVYHMHGYTAAWILPEGLTPAGAEISEQPAHRYAALTIAEPFNDPFVTIPGGYRALGDYMRVNGLTHSAGDAIPCFETDGSSMDIYIACK